MTGNQSWSVLDLDDERLGDECVGIAARVGVTWINSRHDFYEDSIEKLFRPTGELLAEAPTRVAQMQAEALLEWMAHDQERCKLLPAVRRAVGSYTEQTGLQDWSRDAIVAERLEALEHRAGVPRGL